MKKFLEKWNKMSTFERAMTAVNLACSVLVVLFAVLFLLDIATYGVYIAMPLMGVALLSQCGLYWKKDRTMALFSLMAAIFILGITIYMAIPR